MSWLLFWGLLLICALVTLQAVIRRGGLYTYPALCALIVLGWACPQLFVLLDFPELPSGALELTLLMIVLSMLALLWGWRRGAKRLRPRPVLEFDNRKLLIGAVALSLFGAFFRLAIRTVDVELLEMRQWSGPQTIYIFLAGTQYLGLAIAWLLFLRQRNRIALGIVIFNLAFFMDSILIAGRRGVMIDVGFILLGGLWFARRWVPSRAVLIAGAIMAALFVNAITEFRIASNEVRREGESSSMLIFWKAVGKIDFLASFERATIERDPRMMEMYNATLIIGGTHERLEFAGFGNYWNALVFRYVPGQIVGFDLKRSLMVSTSNPMSEAYGAQAHTGTTQTGFADAFHSFWFFGAFVFFGFAWMMRVLWERAMEGGFLLQFLYLVLMKDALHAVTHRTSWFVNAWPFVLIFAGAAFWFASSGRSDDPAPTSSVSTSRRYPLPPLPNPNKPSSYRPTPSSPVRRGSHDARHPGAD